MRTDWVPYSASALVTGAMSMVLGALLNPVAGSQNAAATLRGVSQEDARWMAMAVMFFVASVFLTLGLPALLSLFVDRGRRVGLFAVAVFSIGTIGLSGFAMLMVFMRALVVKDLIRVDRANSLENELGLEIFLAGWVAGFYVGVILLAIALFAARRTPVWVPALLLLFVVAAPFTQRLGQAASAIQLFALAVAFTGVAVQAVSEEQRQMLRRQSVF